MKIYTSTWRNHWISPYTILEKVFFWRKGYDAYKNEPPKWLQSFCEGLKKFLDTVHPRINYIKIDCWDWWNADNTMASIALPLLKGLKENKHGAGAVDNEDVPFEIMSCNAPRVEDEWDTDDFYFLRYDYILDEIVWTFEQLVNDDLYPDDEERINNGLRLYGKYFRSFWD